jgi:hypothetical protein
MVSRDRPERFESSAISMGRSFAATSGMFF